jgi:hypothetical protein
MEDSEKIKGLLERSPYEQLRTVKVSLEDDRVILTGTVRSFYMKQMAQESLRIHRHAIGLNGHVIDNRICVED